MSPRLFCAALLVCVLPVVTAAQDGLRSASLPERTPTNPIAPAPTDLFRAGPDTYRPHPNPFPPPYVTSVYSPWGQAEGRRSRERSRRRDGEERRTSREESRPSAAPVTPAPAPLPVPVVRAAPRTFYVIPGCYAGDRRPNPARLPSGCSMSKLRAVPPLVSRVSSPRS